MPAPTKKRILSRLPGFFFGPGIVFPAEASEKVYRALLGDFRHYSTVEAVICARGSVTELFAAAMGQAFLYKALRGGAIAWEMIANSAILHGELNAHETQVAVEALLTARRAFNGTKVDNLTALVDQIAFVVDETATLGPIQTLSLAVHPGNPAIGSLSQTASNESAAIIDSLADAMRKLHVQHPWPPAYLTQGELLVLARAPITRALAGVDPDHREPAPNTLEPIASSRSAPLVLQVALCRHTLTQYRPKADWTLHLSPVGFRDKEARVAWLDILGPQHAKHFANLSVFFSAACDALSNRGKAFALGMLTHWHHLPALVCIKANAAGVEPSEMWLNGVGTQRFASVMVIRRVLMGEDEEDGIQVIWYDPWMHAAQVKKQAGPHKMSVFAYRRTVVEGVHELARKADLGIHSRYWGGYGAMSPDIEGDSVKLCLAFLEKFASGERMGELFPDPDDEEGFGKMGFKLAQ